MAALKYWKLITMGILALVIAVLFVKLGHANNQIEKRDIRINELVGELTRISTVKNEQVERTKETIRYVERIRKEAGGVADKIEAAPLPGQCRTPDAILGADL